MPFRLIAVFMLCACASSGLAPGQQAGPESDVSGSWMLSADLFGTTMYLPMELKHDGDKLSGTYSRDKLTTGTVSGDAIHLLATTTARSPKCMQRLKMELSQGTRSRPTPMTQIIR
jgi:hypothetical protein